MKIKKNLSDEEMFKGYVEKESFENAFDADEKIVSSKMKNKAAAAKELLLPAEAQEKLNQYLLEISMDWFKNGNGDVVWKIYRLTAFTGSYAGSCKYCCQRYLGRQI